MKSLREQHLLYPDHLECLAEQQVRTPSLAVYIFSELTGDEKRHILIYKIVVSCFVEKNFGDNTGIRRKYSLTRIPRSHITEPPV